MDIRTDDPAPRLGRQYAMKAAIRFAPVLSLLPMLVACGGPASGPLLQSRVQAAMTPTQPCNRMASIQYVPNGARIAVPPNALFLPGKADLTECGQFAMASAIEAMLDPAIMYVAIEPYGDISAPYAGLSQARTTRLQTMFSKAGATVSPPPATPSPAAPTPDAWGIVLTVGDRG